jgi:cytochrome c biogenesis protein CcdA
VEGLFNYINDLVQTQGWLAFPACFFGGVISSASPCVLAMIPLVIGYVGGYAEGSQKKAVQYSLVFTLGLTFTFTILGIIAGAFGRLFGDVGRFWYYVLPPVAILLGLYLLFSDKLNFNIGVSQRFMPKRKALLGAFLIGLFFGIVASPCATPLLAYALGHWVLVLGAGISAGFAQKVLASRGISNFSTYSKKAGGVILIGVGIYLFTYLL